MQNVFNPDEVKSKRFNNAAVLAKVEVEKVADSKVEPKVKF